MLFFANRIKKIASTPLWANVVNLDDGSGPVQGFWVDSSLGMPFFLRKSDHVIWLPKTLRGKKLDSLTPEELQNVPKEDSGKVHYKNWKATSDKRNIAAKLFNGYAFTDAGIQLVQGLKKLADKYELDDVTNVRLERRLSINPGLFDRLLQCNNLQDVQRLGRLIVRKFVFIIKNMSLTEPKIAKRLDADFMYQYKKIEPLFDIDPLSIDVELPEAFEENQIPDPRLDHVKVLMQNCEAEIEPIMDDDLQLSAPLTWLKDASKVLKKAQDIQSEDIMEEVKFYLVSMISCLHKLAKVAPADHPLVGKVEQILNAKSLNAILMALAKTGPQM